MHTPERFGTFARVPGCTALFVIKNWFSEAFSRKFTKTDKNQRNIVDFVVPSLPRRSPKDPEGSPKGSPKVPEGSRRFPEGFPEGTRRIPKVPRKVPQKTSKTSLKQKIRPKTSFWLHFRHFWAIFFFARSCCHFCQSGSFAPPAHSALLKRSVLHPQRMC